LHNVGLSIDGYEEVKFAGKLKKIVTAQNRNTVFAGKEKRLLTSGSEMLLNNCM